MHIIHEYNSHAQHIVHRKTKTMSKLSTAKIKALHGTQTCACEPVLQVIAHDAVLLWPDGPERASKSTKKTAQRDSDTMCCFACSTSCMAVIRRMPRENLNYGPG